MLREALCTLGNGYFFTRGAAPESRADGIHYPGTYIAGGYNRLETDIPGRVVQNEDLVNMPNWLGLNFRIGDDDWLNIHSVHLLTHRPSATPSCRAGRSTSTCPNPPEPAKGQT